LTQRLARGPLPLDEALQIAIAIADALAAAHRERIVHRDLKPSNVMITREGWVKVLDFGLAVLAEPALGTAADGSTLPASELAQELAGTAPYMAPEQAAGRDVDARTDLFSLGVVLYEATTGRRPFAGKAVVEVLAAILRDVPPPPSALDAALPERLDAIVRRCLEKDPAGRYGSSSVLRADLAALRDEVRAGAPLRAPRVQSDLHAIAVLPLDDLSGEATQTWFVDGMTEAIITGLARIRGLRVIARNSVMRYRGTAKPPRAVAQELGVGAVVTGSILRAGERTRINVQLVEGATEQLLWAESYERDLRDVLHLQSDVAEAVAREVQVTLTPQDRARLAPRGSVDPRAWEAYLRGRHHWNRRTEEEVRRGVECFRDAIEADPSFGLAHVGLAESYAVLGFWSFMAPEEAFPRTKAAATKALELQAAEARVALAYARHYYDWDWAESEREYRLAIEGNPHYPTAHHFFTNLLVALGRFDEALAEFRKALDLDPMSLIINGAQAWAQIHRRAWTAALDRLRLVLDLDRNFGLAWMFQGWARLGAGQAQEAIEDLRTACRLMDGAVIAEAFLGHALGVAGDEKGARAALDGLVQRGSRRHVPAYFIALVHAGLADPEGALAWLERAVSERSHWATFLAVDPRWDALRSEPRFAALVRQVGLPGA
jgi:serine/threonine-protein kinase